MEVFYLKMNYAGDVAQEYLKHWLDILSEIPDSKIYVLCNGIRRVNWLRRNFSYDKENYQFMNDYRESEDLDYIVENAMTDNGLDTGHTTLTPFFHARENNYKDFWIIDADSISIYAKADKLVELFESVKKSAQEICFLDIWTTLTKGALQTFGVSYVNNSVNWLEIMKAHCKDNALKERYENMIGGINADCLFMYLNDIDEITVKTFCVENMRIVHHRNDIYREPFALRYCKNNRMYFPTLSQDFKMGEKGSLPVPKKVINIDIGLTERESQDCMLENVEAGEIV